MRHTLFLLVAGSLSAACAATTSPSSSASTSVPVATAAEAEIDRDEGEVVTIESWRREDRQIWEEVLIPSFEADHPGIDVVFAPSDPVAYESELAERLALGTAGEIIACRPFERSRRLYETGVLAPANDFVDLSSFPRSASTAWTGTDGVVYCVPIASVAHGFLYNADVLDSLEISPPRTESEFFDLLGAVIEDGRFDALALGASGDWEFSEIGLLNIGPTYWNGESGRVGLVNGDIELDDSGVREALTALARWEDYLPTGVNLLTSDDAFELFRSEAAVVFPAGSWELSRVVTEVEFTTGFFPPPRRNADDECQITEELDLGYGLLASSADDEAAVAVLEWIASAEFAAAHAAALPGFFSLHPSSPESDIPLVAEFDRWRTECERSLRLPTQFVQGGSESVREALWRIARDVGRGQSTVDEAMNDLSGVIDVSRPEEPVESIFD